MTQAKFAEIIGLSVEAVKCIEYKKYTPSTNTIDTICSTFNISPIDLLIPALSENKDSIITAINGKLRDCELIELNSINTMIDVIRKTYRHK